MPKEATNERCNFILADSRDDYAVTGMPQLRLIESRVPREEGGIALSPQQDSDFIVHQTFVAEVNTDLPWRETPCIKEKALSFENVFIEDDQTGTCPGAYSEPV